MKTITIILINIFLCFTQSSFADESHDLEIGVPVIESYIAPHLTALAPNDERMYLFSQGELTHYNLNPLEIISIIKVDFSVFYLLHLSYQKA